MKKCAQPQKSNIYRTTSAFPLRTAAANYTFPRARAHLICNEPASARVRESRARVLLHRMHNTLYNDDALPHVTPRARATSFRHRGLPYVSIIYLYRHTYTYIRSRRQWYRLQARRARGEQLSGDSHARLRPPRARAMCIERKRDAAVASLFIDRHLLSL